MHWTPKELEDDGSVKLVRFVDGRLFSILRDRTKKNPTYTLGDELGMIERSPKHQGPLSERLLLTILNEEGARPISLGDAQQMRANHRAMMRGASEGSA